MKRYKLSAIIIAAVMTVCSLFTSVSAESSEWIYIDDKGMFDSSENHEKYLDGRWYGYYLENEELKYVTKLRHRIEFTVNTDIPDAQNQVRSIIEKYNSPCGITGEYSADALIVVKEGECGGILEYQPAYWHYADILLPQIRDELIENNLVTKLYERGQTGYYRSVLSQSGQLNNVYNMELDQEAVQKYLDDNLINCTITTQQPDDYVKGMYYLVPDETLSHRETFEIAVKLYEEFGISPLYRFNSPEDVWHDAKPYYQTEFKSTISTITGDLDLDNDTGLADIVILSKYHSNAEIYPISDETARANADVNKDGEINSLDINILIEQLLGSFESAV